MAQSPPGLTRRPEGRIEDLERMGQRVAELRAGVGRDVQEVRSRVRDGLDVRRQLVRHPFVAAAAVLGAAYVAARILRALVRRVGPRSAKAAGRRRGAECRSVAHGRSRGAGTYQVQTKEGVE